ncbi:MAG: TatD family deoxyribonuclease, partial [Anaerolineales bacterium]
RARDVGVLAIIEAGTDVESSLAAVDLAKEYGFIYPAVGIHPHSASQLTAKTLGQIESLAQEPKVVAIGEIGLDYYRDLSPRSAQRSAFEEQLGLADRLGLPVIVHCRDAFPDTMAALRGWKRSGVLHSYSGGTKHLSEVLELGMMVGISGAMTFAGAEDLRRAAEQAPLEALLVETDCPYLAPVPRRGKRNEPAYVRHTVDAVAVARSLATEAVANATSQNARELFRLE